MSEHLSAQIVDEYRRRLMSPTQLLAVDDHLATCEECRRLASDALELETVTSSLRMQLQAEAASFESDHLQYEQIAALVDGEIEMSERKALESHLEICSLCAEEVKDLQAFRAEALAAPLKKSELSARPTFWERMEAFGRSVGLPIRPAITAALAVLIVSVSLGLFFAWRATRRAESPSSPTAAASPKPDSTGSPANAEKVDQPSGPQPEPTADESQVVLSLNDGGGRVTLDAKGNLAGLESLTPSSRQAVKQALTTERVEVPTGLSELIGKKGTLLGPTDQNATFSLLSPVGTVTRTGRPTLRWTRLSGATSYSVAVLDSDFNPVATSPSITGTDWIVPRELERGRVYSWQVTAVKNGKEIISPAAPAPEARFKVLEKAKSDELMSVEKAGVNSHLARGTLYARAGLLDDAERELRALLSANPNSLTARKLLRSLQTIRKR